MMRVLTFLLAAGLLAGCAATDDGNPTPTPTSDGSGNAGGGSGTGATGTQVKKDTHDFTADVAGGTPAGSATTTAITVPAGVTTLNVTVKFDPAQGAPGAVSSGINVKVGAVTCAVPAGPVVGSSTCTGKTAATGVKAIEYSGAGPVVATVTVLGT